MEIVVKHQHVSEDSLKVELTRGQRGGYGWTLTVRADTESAVLSTLQSLDQQLRAKFGSGNGEVA